MVYGRALSLLPPRSRTPFVSVESALVLLPLLPREINHLTCSRQKRGLPTLSWESVLPFPSRNREESSNSVEGAFFSSLPCLKKVRRVAVIGNSQISAALQRLVDSIARSSAYGPKARVFLRDRLCDGGLHAVL